jgi:hypothetical protein
MAKVKVTVAVGHPWRQWSEEVVIVDDTDCAFDSMVEKAAHFEVTKRLAIAGTEYSFITTLAIEDMDGPEEDW